MEKHWIEALAPGDPMFLVSPSGGYFREQGALPLIVTRLTKTLIIAERHPKVPGPRGEFRIRKVTGYLRGTGVYHHAWVVQASDVMWEEYYRLTYTHAITRVQRTVLERMSTDDLRSIATIINNTRERIREEHEAVSE